MKLTLFEPQPAEIHYVFWRAWPELREAVTAALANARAGKNIWARQSERLESMAEFEDQPLLKTIRFTLSLICRMLGWLQIGVALLTVLVFAGLHGFFLAIVAAVVGLSIIFLQFGNLAYGAIHRMFYRCPDCHVQMVVPIFVCPQCSAEHSRLWPSVYGLFYHTCSRCGARLPTLDILGRRRLAQKCTACRRPLNPDVGRLTDLHIPMIGGTSSGKTVLFVAATYSLLHDDVIRRGMQIELPDPIQRRDFENQARWMDSGVPPLKTYEVVPTAYTLSIRRTSWEVGKLAYLYDAAGEAYSDENKTLQQTYYKYVHALLLVIDPFSIADFARQHESEIKTARDALRPSPTNPIEAYERMLAALESVAGLQRGRPFRQPLAVVLTKTDASDLENRVGSPAAHRLMLAQPWLHREQDAMHLLVERFLTEMGMGNLVRDMSMQFSNLRFFSCSALGRLPDFSDRKPYRPLRAVDPFLWLLGQLNAISLREEICRQSDAAHWARARAAGWSWNMLKEYLWSSLQVRHIPRCPRCDAPLPAGQVVHWSCLLYRSRWLLAVVILALGIIVTGLLFTGTGITK